MLKNKTKNISIKASSVVSVERNGITEEVIAEGYDASIDSDDPENLIISSWQQDKSAYKINRVQCRKDREAFEEMVYELQNAMIAEKNAAEA